MDANSIVTGYAIGYNDGFKNGQIDSNNSGDGGSSPITPTPVETRQSDEWQLPDEWSLIPEPETNEGIMLIYVPEMYIQTPLFCIYFGHGNAPDWNLTEYIDWGDGTITNIVSNYENHQHRYTHFYEKPGYYIIKMHGSDVVDYVDICNMLDMTGNSYNSSTKANASGWHFGDGSNYAYQFSGINQVSARLIKAYKIGYKFCNYKAFSTERYPSLEYIKYCGNAWRYMYETQNNGYWRFPNLTVLKRLDIDNPPTETDLGTNISSIIDGCTSLQSTNLFENMTEIPSADYSSLSVLHDNYALRTINAPNCTKIHRGAFYNLYALEKINVADDCEFDLRTSNASSKLFTGCPALTPPIYDLRSTALVIP